MRYLEFLQYNCILLILLLQWNVCIFLILSSIWTSRCSSLFLGVWIRMRGSFGLNWLLLSAIESPEFFVSHTTVRSSDICKCCLFSGSFHVFLTATRLNRYGWYIAKESRHTTCTVRWPVNWVAILLNELFNVHEATSNSDDDLIVLNLDKHSFHSIFVNTFALSFKPHYAESDLHRETIDLLTELPVHWVISYRMVNELIAHSNDALKPFNFLGFIINHREQLI